MTTRCIPAFQKLNLNILIKVILSNGYMLGIFRKSVGKIPVSLKSDKNYGHFTYRLMYICDYILLKRSFLFFRKLCHLWHVEKIFYSRTGHRYQYGTYALHAGYLRLQTHTRNMWYLLCSTVTLVTRTPLITLYVHWLSCSLLVAVSCRSNILQVRNRILW